MDEGPNTLSDGTREAPGSDSSSSANIDSEQQALQLATELFPGPAHFEDICDPERPEDQWRMIVVSAQGDSQDVVARTVAWHSRMFTALGERGAHITICVLPEAV